MQRNLCIEVVRFFGTVQKLYNIFNSNPQRWEILKNITGCSLHTMSNTRWSPKLKVLNHLPEKINEIKNGIDSVLELNLTSETRSDLNRIKNYMECIE